MVRSQKSEPEENQGKSTLVKKHHVHGIGGCCGGNEIKWPYIKAG
jgi:methionine synthase I (cobalamin-dependent)